MQFVIVKHGNHAGTYLFTVPEGRNLKLGDRIICKTRYGNTYGTCMTNSFGIPRSHTARICSLWGTDEQSLQPVIGTVEETIWDEDLPF